MSPVQYSVEVNTWNLGFTDGGGNYWSDYEGVDEDENGYGDTPRYFKSWILDGKEIKDENNIDNLPRISPKEINTGKELSDLTIMLPAGFITEGGTIHVEGALIRDYEYPIPNEDTNVMLLIENPSGTVEAITRPVIDGSYEYDYETETYGQFIFSVTWDGNLLYEGDASEEKIFSVEQEELPPEDIDTELDVTLTSDFEFEGPLTVSGYLRDLTGEGLSGYTVEIGWFVHDPDKDAEDYLFSTGPALTLATDRTDSGGAYSQVLTLDTTGEDFVIVCRFTGFGQYQPSYVVSTPFFVGVPEPYSTGIPGFPIMSIILGSIIIAYAMKKERSSMQF